MLRTCTAWCAAIHAVPALWPETVLVGRSAENYTWEWDGRIDGAAVQRALQRAADANRMTLQRAAGLGTLTWRVRIAGPYYNQVRARAWCKQIRLTGCAIAKLRWIVKTAGCPVALQSGGSLQAVAPPTG